MTSTPEEVLARRIKVRAGHRGSATRLIAQAEADLTADPLNHADLELSVANLSRKVEVLTPLDAEILELTPDDAIEAEIDHADQYQDNIQRILSKLNKAITAPAPRTDPIPRTDPTPIVPPAPAAGAPTISDPPVGERAIPSAHHGNKVRLPKLTLPHFNGNPVKWTGFWDSYDSAIHSNDELSEVDKFNYLRSLLEGSAFEAVRGLTLSGQLSRCH